MKFSSAIITFYFIIFILLQGCTNSKVLLHLTDVQQETTYTCGASAAKSILLYYGIDCSENQVVQNFGTNEESGTSPQQMLQGFSKYGLEAIIKENASLKDISCNLENNLPTLVAIQAWLENYPPLKWETTWEDGHWVIIIGMDDQNIYFEDPSLFGTRGYLTKGEFLSRWHDYVGEAPCCDSLDKIYNHLIITVKGDLLKSITHID